ncbi:uncharacterized protein LOC111381493 [Olea europaea var. sylvestris]|uniref:uncharacterized protein LOC111381493 n=1 Tax=Olea europaea var. sylvestris TaxID=158386 RepID=UPI000C1D4266|nr:uncharacterized protein LOC111381493 [Olea europaea var. sylvestris]
MANIIKLEFAAIDISGRNYLSWVLDTDIHLVSKGLGNKRRNKESLQDRAKELIFLRHHLHNGLKIEYLIEKDSHQQYYERGFKKYSKLISCMLVTEQNNELLMKNHGLRPTGSVLLPEVNGIALPEANAISRQGRGRGHGFGHGRKRGRSKPWTK